MTQADSGGIHVQASLCSYVLPVRDHTEHTPPPATEMQQHVYDVSVQRGPLDTQPTRVFIGDWLCSHSLPSPYQNSRFPEGNQMFGTNHTVCINTISTMSHSRSLSEQR